MKKHLCVWFMVCLWCLSTAAAVPADTRTGKHDDEKSVLLPAALVTELENWVERADFWRLVAHAEYTLTKVEVIETDSKAVEAWVCGANKICLTSRLRQMLTSAETQAAIAHEIAHLVIPRPKKGHAQLWEIQCDLLAAALLRDVTVVKEMLNAVDQVCVDCRDAEHLAPYERIALLEYCADLPLEKVNRYDILRQGSYALFLSDLELPKPRQMPIE